MDFSGFNAPSRIECDVYDLVIEGQVRHMKLLRHANGDRLIVVARNDNTLQVIRAPRPASSAALANSRAR